MYGIHTADPNSTCTVLSGSVCRQVSQGLCADTLVFHPRCGELGLIHLLQALGFELALLVLFIWAYHVAVLVCSTVWRVEQDNNSVDEQVASLPSACELQ